MKEKVRMRVWVCGCTLVLLVCVLTGVCGGLHSFIFAVSVTACLLFL